MDAKPMLYFFPEHSSYVKWNAPMNKYLHPVCSCYRAATEQHKHCRMLGTYRYVVCVPMLLLPMYYRTPFTGIRRSSALVRIQSVPNWEVLTYSYYLNRPSKNVWHHSPVLTLKNSMALGIEYQYIPEEQCSSYPPTFLADSLTSLLPIAILLNGYLFERIVNLCSARVGFTSSSLSHLADISYNSKFLIRS